MLGIAFDEVLSPGTVVDVGGMAIPIHNQADIIGHETRFTSYNLTLVGDSLLPNLLRASAFPSGMDEFNAVSVGQANQGGICHETLGPVPMSVEQAEQSGAMGQIGEQFQIIALQPTVKGTIVHPFASRNFCSFPPRP